MTLKYSDDDITDEELRELDLQMAAQQYMMQQDSQNETTPLPFQQAQITSQELWEEDNRYLPDRKNTKLNQVPQKELAKLPGGSPGYKLQIPYLQKFFGTPWYLVHKDISELYAIYDMIFSETPIMLKLNL